MKKIVLMVDVHDDKAKQKALKTVATLSGVDSIGMEMNEKKLTVVGKVDPISLVSKLRKQWPTTHLISVGPVMEPEKKQEAKKDGEEKKEEAKKEEDKKDGAEEKKEEKKDATVLMDPMVKMYYPVQLPRYYYVQSMEENPNSCIIC